MPRLMLDQNAAASARDAETKPTSADENRATFARKRKPTTSPSLSWRPAYAHVSPVHMVARDGAVTVVDARDVFLLKHAPRETKDKDKEKEKEKENAERESAGGGFFSGAPTEADARGAHQRAHRAHCWQTRRARGRTSDDRPRKSTAVRWSDGSGTSAGGRPLGRRFFSGPTGLPPPAGDALFTAPQPRPFTAAATVERDAESRPSLLVTVTGEDLELCESVAAETNGWPCGATLVATRETTPFSFFERGALRTLLVRVYPPTLNGALVPAPLFGGGGDAKDWSRVVVALRGDFGDARVAVRVEDASGFAETPRSRL